MNLLACNLVSYGRYADGALAHLRELGVRHVEFAVPPPEELDAARARLERHGLAARSLHAPCDLSRDEGVDEFAASLPAFGALEAAIAFVSAQAGEAPLAECHARLRRMGDAAAHAGVTLAVETHPPLAHNADAALATLAAVDHPNVRLNYDTGNVYFYNEDFQGLDDLKRIREQVVSVHLKDTSGGYRHWHFPALGDGVVDFAEVFRLLNEVGFRGPFTLELEGIEGEQLTEAETRDRVTRSVEHLRRLNVVGG